MKAKEADAQPQNAIPWGAFWNGTSNLNRNPHSLGANKMKSGPRFRMATQKSPGYGKTDTTRYIAKSGNRSERSNSRKVEKVCSYILCEKRMSVGSSQQHWQFQYCCFGPGGGYEASRKLRRTGPCLPDAKSSWNWRYRIP